MKEMSDSKKIGDIGLVNILFNYYVNHYGLLTTESLGRRKQI